MCSSKVVAVAENIVHDVANKLQRAYPKHLPDGCSPVGEIVAETFAEKGKVIQDISRSKVIKVLAQSTIDISLRGCRSVAEVKSYDHDWGEIS